MSRGGKTVQLAAAIAKFQAQFDKLEEGMKNNSMEEQMQIMTNLLSELCRQQGGEIVLPLASVENDSDEQMLISWDKEAGTVKIMLLPDFVRAGIQAQRDEEAREAEAKLKNAIPSGQVYAGNEHVTDEFSRTVSSPGWSQLDPSITATGGPATTVKGTFQASSAWTNLKNATTKKPARPKGSTSRISGKNGDIYLASSDGTKQTKIATKTEWSVSIQDDGLRVMSKK